MYTKIYGREKWETGRIKRLVSSYLESDELWLLEREWMTYRSLKMTLERQWDRHLGCEASRGIRFRQRPTSRGKETNKTTKNKKMGKWKTFQTTERVTTGEITIDKLLVSTIIKVCTYVVYTAPPQLLVAVTTRSTRKFGCRPCCWDCASTVGWESNIHKVIAV